MDKNEENILNQIWLKGSQGVNKGFLKKFCNLSQGLVTNSLKSLIWEGLIWDFKTKKKGQCIYVASEFNPDLDLVGGSLFTDG